MAKTMQVVIQRSTHYLVSVDDDFDIDTMDTDEIGDFVNEAGMAESDEIYLDSVYIYNADGKQIYEEV